jgi:hypothetical protein
MGVFMHSRTFDLKDTELPRMTSQEMIKDSVAQSIRQEILSMLVCW